MPTAWRLAIAEFAGSAFTGEGAAIFSGRWNHAQTPVVYLGATLSLCALEVLVHAGRHIRHPHVAFPVEFTEDLVTTIPVEGLPDDWRAIAPVEATRDLGARWVNEARSPVLRVPSALIPHEANYLLNPAHPDFERLAIAPAEPFSFDPRLMTK